MPRNKRWPYNCGLQVPLIVHIPDKYRDVRPADYQAGGTSDRLVSFVDFAPTLLSLAGLQAPVWMQGHAFLGKYIAPRQPFLYGFRGRMDERYDLVRSVTDGRFVYVRQYLPQLIYGQHVEYMFQTPTTRIWKQLHDQGRLTVEQDAFWNRKPSEELYDLQHDPDEVHNLADSADHQAIKSRLHQALRQLAARIRDVGFLPEGERAMRAGADSPYDMGHDDRRYPFERIFAAAELASMPKLESIPALKLLLKDDDSAVRYWGVIGIQIRGRDATAATRAELRQALDDNSPYVAVAAAQTLAEFGTDEDLQQSLPRLVARADWSQNDVYICMAALNSLDAIEDKAASVAADIRRLPATGPLPDPRYSPYVPRLLEDLNAKFR